jgi:hypothetical protein
MSNIDIKIPAKSEITYLEADQVQKPIGFKIFECQGMPLSSSHTEDLQITKKEDLKVGDVVYSYGMLGEKIELTVTSLEEGKATADCGAFMFCFLEFQNCSIRGSLWVNSCMVNKRCMYDK